jgi:hypothetical protein
VLAYLVHEVAHYLHWCRTRMRASTKRTAETFAVCVVCAVDEHLYGRVIDCYPPETGVYHEAQRWYQAVGRDAAVAWMEWTLGWAAQA